MALQRLPFFVVTFLVAGAPSAAADLQESFETTPDRAVEECAALPAGWLRVDADARIPNEGTSWVTEAWCRTGDPDRPGNEVVASNSWYEPTGAADDWLITPPVELGSSPLLSWKGESDLSGFLESYEVRLSTGGAAPDDFDVLLTTIEGEPADALTPHEIDLGPFAGQTVRVAWRNVSNDQFLLLIDEVRILDGDRVIFLNGFEGPSEPCAWISLPALC